MIFKSTITSIKNGFNWLADKPTHNYTIGEAYQHFVKDMPWSEITDNRFGLSRIGRTFERATTGVGLLVAGEILTSQVSLPAVFTAAAIGILFKLEGVLVGKVVDNIFDNKHGSNPFIFRTIVEDYKEAKLLRENKNEPKL